MKSETINEKKQAQKTLYKALLIFFAGPMFSWKSNMLILPNTPLMLVAL